MTAKLQGDSGTCSSTITPYFLSLPSFKLNINVVWASDWLDTLSVFIVWVTRLVYAAVSLHFYQCLRETVGTLMGCACLFGLWLCSVQWPSLPCPPLQPQEQEGRTSCVVCRQLFCKFYDHCCVSVNICIFFRRVQGPTNIILIISQSISIR